LLNIIRYLNIILACAFLLIISPSSDGAENIYNAPLNLPPLCLINKVRIVLSPETAFLAGDKPVWTLIPHISFIPNDYNISAIFITNFNPSDTKMKYSIFNVHIDAGKENDILWMDKSLIAFAKDIANPIYNYMMYDNISANNTEYANYLYTDISAIAISHLVRGITNNQLDLHLLTHQDSNNYLYINGLELGIRPDPFFGFRVKVWDDNNTTNSYGIELQIFPTENIAFKIMREDNLTERHTGLELHLKF
jgi:hypothetical protein